MTIRGTLFHRVEQFAPFPFFAPKALPAGHAARVIRDMASQLIAAQPVKS